MREIPLNELWVSRDAIDEVMNEKSRIKIPVEPGDHPPLDNIRYPLSGGRVLTGQIGETQTWLIGRFIVFKTGDQWTQSSRQFWVAEFPDKRSAMFVFGHSSADYDEVKVQLDSNELVAFKRWEMVGVRNLDLQYEIESLVHPEYRRRVMDTEARVFCRAFRDRGDLWLVIHSHDGTAAVYHEIELKQDSKD